MLEPTQRSNIQIVRMTAAIILLAILMMAMPAGAQAPIFGSYTAGFAVQNLSGSAATVVLEYYDASTGNRVVGPLSVSVSANSLVTYFPINDIAAGFNGSAVVSSNQPIASVVVLEAKSPNNVDTSATYTALTTSATSVFIPQLFKNHFGILDSWYAVQNAGTSAATVNVSYSDGTTAGPVTIQAGASAFFYQNSEAHNASIFAATINSDQPIVATAVQEDKGQNQLRAYNGTSGGSTELFMPLAMMNHWGFKTVLMIQNTGGVDTTVTMQYTPNAVAPTYGVQCTEQVTIAAGASVPFMVKVMKDGNSHPAGTVSDCVNGTRFLGSAKVIANSANQPLVAMVEVANNVGSDLHNPFDPSTATNNVAFPLIMDRSAGYRSVIRIFNVGSTAATVTCTFANTSYSYGPVTLQPGESFVEAQWNKVSNGYVGSGVCTAGAGAQIVGTGEIGVPGAQTDTNRFYDGVNY